jgi:MFS family permease
MPTDSETGDTTLDAREAAYDTFVWANLRRNYLGHYLHGMLGMTGFRLISAPTFLPAYLHLISGSAAVVGLGLALQQLGGIIAPIFGASKVEHLPRVMPAAVWIGISGRIAILGMALSGWFLKGQPLVIALLSFILMFGISMGAQRVVFSLLMSKVIPINRRGRLQAWRNATGGLIAAVLAYFAGKWFIETNLFGNGYSTTFILAFLLTSAGLWALQMLMREPDPVTLRNQTRLRDRLRDFPAMFAQDRAYGWFLGVQMLATSARIATPFFILHVGKTVGTDGATLGLLSAAFLGADTLSNLLWGYLGDKTGFRLVLVLSIVLWIGATILAMTVHEPSAMFLTFAGLGAALAGYQMAAGTMILEFGDRHDLPMRLAVSTTAESITATAGPLIGGVVAQMFGFPVVFTASLVMLSLALAVLLIFVKEPRKKA